jgi:type I restriction enzyme S subunit
MVSGKMVLLRPNPQLVDPRFLAAVLSTPEPQSFLDACKTGMAESQMNFANEDLLNLRLTLPEIDLQRRIADFLDAEIARIEILAARQRMVDALLEERNRALTDSLVDQLRYEFGTAPFRRFITRIEQGHSPQCDNIEAVAGEWGVLKVSAVKGGRFEPQENKRLPDGQTPLKRYEIRDGDLLVTRANTPSLVGAAAVAHEPPSRLLLCDKIFRIEVSPILNKDFVALVARSARIRAMCAEASHGASQSMANLKTQEIKDWPIPIAPLDAQRDSLQRIEDESKVIDHLRDLIGAQLEMLDERRQALITAAVTGEFDVTTAQGADLP